MNGWAQPCGGSSRKRCSASDSLAYTLADRSSSGRLRRASVVPLALALISLAATRGPDAGGYSATDDVVYSFVDLAGAGGEGEGGGLDSGDRGGGGAAVVAAAAAAAAPLLVRGLGEAEGAAGEERELKVKEARR